VSTIASIALVPCGSAKIPKLNATGEKENPNIFMVRATSKSMNGRLFFNWRAASPTPVGAPIETAAPLQQAGSWSGETNMVHSVLKNIGES
jgi:hypothetical protein